MDIKNLTGDKFAFHCDSEEKARELIKKAYELGYKWSNSCEDNTYFDTYMNDTCYKFHDIAKIISFSNMDFFKEEGYKIVEYEFDERKKKPTPFEYIMEYLGVKEDEEFNIDGEFGNPHRFSDGYLKNKYDDVCSRTMNELINGNLTLEKLQWKPNVDDIVCCIDTNGKIHYKTYVELAADLALLKNRWIFSTEEEAEANRERIMKEYAEVLDKAKIDDEIWRIGTDGRIRTDLFSKIPFDLAMMKNGWYFSTKEEAEANRERVLKEYAEVLDKAYAEVKDNE